jgi:UDP-3-O-[3-hydroxymyristoyl] glucosamine N-acyltransferase
VHVGSGSCVDRAKTGETRIGTGSRIDNLVQVGHGVHVGPFSVLVAQVGLSGSVAVGTGCVLAGQVGVADHVHIGDGTVVSAQSGVTGNLPANGVFMGLPARPAPEWRRIQAAQARLPRLIQRVRRLEKLLGPVPEDEQA